MRVVLSLLVFVAAATAQVDRFLRELPTCAITCTIQYAPTSGCALTDLECVCHAAQLWVDMEACVLANCTTKEGLTTQSVAADACEWSIRDKGVDVAVLGPVLTALSLIFVGARLISRQPGKGDLSGWDDVVIVAAWLSSVPLAVLDVMFYKVGLGKDIWRVPFDHITDLLRYFYAGEIVYLTSTVLVKIALLLFFLRVFPNYTFRLASKIVIGLCVAFWFSFLIALLFQCTPVRYAWLRWDGEHQGTCTNVYVGGFVHAALNMVFDIVILILPLPLIYQLQRHYSWKQKSHIFIMFSFGLIVTVVCILRLNTLVTFGKSMNPTYDYTAAAIWSMVEVQVSIICACLPAAKKFVARFLPNWFGTTAKDSKQSASEDIAKDKSARSDSTPLKSPGIINVKVNQAEGFTELVDMEDQRYAADNRSWAGPSPRSMSPLTVLPNTYRYSMPLSMDQRERSELDSYGISR